MRIFYFMILLCYSITAGAQSKCGPAVPVLAVYYTHQPDTKFGFGLEGGTQGIESPFGLYGGFYFIKMSEKFMKTDSTDFSLRGSLYIRGAVRLTQAEGRGSVFFTAAPEVSVQTGFDFKTGLRFMLPINGKKAIGIEPLYSFKNQMLSVNILAAF